jgi:hypothetical protein
LARPGIGSLKVSPSSEFMWGRARISCVFLAVACVPSPGLSANALDTATNIDIGTNEIGASPAQFELPLLGDGNQGSWTVVHDARAEAGVAIEQPGAQTGEDRLPLAIYKPASLKDAEISLRIYAAGGKSDQGGGLAVRLKTPENYYLVQLDALRDRVLFSLVSNGASEEIVGVDADIALHSWHTLTVRAIDNEFTVSLDGEWVFTAFDKTLSQAGRVGLWTKSDSNTQFDQIEIAPLP